MGTPDIGTVRGLERVSLIDKFVVVTRTPSQRTPMRQSPEAMGAANNVEPDLSALSKLSLRCAGLTLADRIPSDLRLDISLIIDPDRKDLKRVDVALVFRQIPINQLH